MNITICERGCGKTSLDADADIETVSVALSVNGAEPMKLKTEACKECRAEMASTIKGLFDPRPVQIQVRRLDTCRE